VTAETPAHLEQIMADLVAAHESLLALAAEQRAALSRADSAAVESAARRQAALAHEVARLDETRRRVIALLLPGSTTTSMAAVAAALPEPARTRLTAVGRRLRDLLARLQDEQRVLRTATTALVAHMDGLMQQVARALSSANLYGPRGRLDHAPSPPCGLDLTT
jgi:flagellar FlgN protein